MKNFFTNLAIEHLRKNDFIIINRAEVAKDKSTFIMMSCFFSYLHRLNHNAILTNGHK
jgi:hypothetical protein